MHAKSIPPTKVTKRFLCSSFDSLFQIRQQSITEIFKGKSPCVTAVSPAGDNSLPISAPWPKPAPGWVALSVDGSFHEDGSAGSGMVLRNHDGVVIFSAYRHLFHCNDALEAEISALMEGLKLAHQWSDDPIVIQSDSALALAAVRDKTCNRSVHGHLYEEVKRLINLRDVILVKLKRDQNRVAHSLANLGRIGGSTACWVHHSPDCITELMLADCNPMIEE
uniref:Uncharacterized protein n=1 Tax=Avena sativa TaxID=4498 RepID=A0ACD5VPB5_AVESA